MTVNPFVALFERPVETLTLAGYVLGLTTLTIATLGVCWSNALETYRQFRVHRPQQWEYVPPLSWLGRVTVIPLVLMVDAWAIAAGIALLT